MPGQPLCPDQPKLWPKCPSTEPPMPPRDCVVDSFGLRRDSWPLQWQPYNQATVRG